MVRGRWEARQLSRLWRLWFCIFTYRLLPNAGLTPIRSSGEKPIVVAAYNSPNGCVVAPSIEAKQYGIRTGMTVRDAKLLYPGVIVRTPDPPKYRAVHMMFR